MAANGAAGSEDLEAYLESMLRGFDGDPLQVSYDGR
jgi:hypothetical protein